MSDAGVQIKDVGLIFDLDGTLIDSAPDIHATALKVLSDQGMPAMDFETVKGFIGAGVGTLIARILAAQGLQDHGAQHLAMVNQFVSLYEKAVDLTTLYPGVSDLLHHLAALGYPMAVCTNKPEGPTRAVLRHFALLGYFPVIVGGDTLAVRKPDPAPLLLAQARLGVARAIFVGDSEVDALTAQAAALPFALFSGGYRKTPVQDLGAAVIFDHHSDFPFLLPRLMS